MTHIGVILLAAGGSTRLGRPKQLIDVGGEPLIRVMARRLTQLESTEICVVVGASSERVGELVTPLGVAMVNNPNWADGIGTSISTGVRWARDRDMEGVLITLCDQPAIPVEHYQTLLTRFRCGEADVIATEYAELPGVPAVFGTSCFDRLIRLTGDRGAKSLLTDPSLRVERISCAAGDLDLDTQEDVDRFRRSIRGVE